MGFGVPIDIWLKNDLRDWAEDLLNEKKLINEGIFNVKSVRKMWDEHLTGKKNNHHKLWAIINFQSWKKNTNIR